MQYKVNEDDQESDKLIEVIVDSAQSSVKRTQASRDLYNRHARWVIQQIGKSIFNAEDVQDIAQNVWMMVLQPEKLGNDYTQRRGKFRAYLQAPIRWAILKHIDKLPFSVDQAGNKKAILAVDVSEGMLENGLNSNILNDVIESIIKPKLRELDTRSRNVYMLNEYNVIFHSNPTLIEAAYINAIAEEKASALLNSAGTKTANTCTDDELSIYIPVEYKSLVETDLLKESSGRYLANLIGVSEAIFRKRLHVARKFLLETVRANLPNLSGDFING